MLTATSGWRALKRFFKENAMCDYSLEIYGSRPAREGEKYVTNRFPSGTMGVASPGSTATAVCLACDTRLLLENIPADTAKRFGVGPSAEAVFIRLDTGSYRDGVKFANGTEASLQQLPPGIGVAVIETLDKPLAARVLETVAR
jgi:hypothetical protein